jgi:iron complex transport system permease protein
VTTPPATHHRNQLAWLAGGAGVLVAAFVVAVLVGPAGISVRGGVGALIDRLPFVTVDSGLSARQESILWDIRMPRVVLGGIVGALLSLCGAAYQGVFRNPLVDPYVLGAAAGGGLGATLVVAYAREASQSWSVDPLPIAAFAGAIVAVTVTYAVGAAFGAGRSVASLVLAGVAVTSFATAVQTFVQQRNADTLREVYNWILGRLIAADWGDVRLVLPYAVVSAAVILLHRRLLDVMRVGEDEADALGARSGRVRLVVVAAATLGTAAAVSVSGLIGFVGIIVPHTVRLVAGASYRLVLPLSILLGAAFLMLADATARTIDAPAEIPIGVVTAFFGAPFFVMLLRLRTVVR